MLLNNKSLNLIQMVNDGLKTAGATAVFIENKLSISYIEEKYPNCYFYYLEDQLTLCFTNKTMFDEHISLNYPEFNDLSYNNVMNKFITMSGEQKWRFFGKLYGYPEICIQEFTEDFDKGNRKFLTSELANICIYYRSNDAKTEAEQFISNIESKFMKKIDNDIIPVLNDVVYLPYESKYGKFAPHFYYSLVLAEVKFVTISHALYNRKGLSTQVPNTVDVLIDKKVKLYYDYRNNYRLFENNNIFNKYKKKEIQYIDILTRIDDIYYDGYFDDKDSLKDAIIKKMNNDQVGLENIQNYLLEYRNFLNETVLKNK